MTNPKTLSESVISLNNTLTPEDKEYIQNSKNKERTAIQLHSSLGRHLRNEWGLWTGSDLANHFKEQGIKHPDDMSHAIIMAYCNSLVK